MSFLEFLTSLTWNEIYMIFVGPLAGILFVLACLSILAMDIYESDPNYKGNWPW